MSDSGSKIRSLATIIFWLTEIIIIIGVCVICISSSETASRSYSYMYGYSKVSKSGIFLTILGGGIASIFNYIGRLFLDSWGTVVENSDKMVSILTRAKETYNQKKQESSLSSRVSSLDDNSQKEKKEEDWTCSRCGCVNPKEAVRCVCCLELR